MGADAEAEAQTRKQTLWVGGALERGHSAPLEPLAQLWDDLRVVGALDMSHLMVEATEPVAGQAVMSGARMVREQECQRALA